MSLFLRKMLIASFAMFSSISYAEWMYAEQKDPFNDNDRSYIHADLMYETDEELYIQARCDFDGLNIALGHRYLAGDSDDEVRVQMRVDQNEPHGPRYWSLNPDNESSWMPMRDVPNMIAQMKLGTRLVIRVVDPHDGDTLDQSVSLAGFSAAVEKLSCYKFNI